MNKNFVILFSVLSVVFMSSLYFHPYPYSYVVKVLPIVILLIAVIMAKPFSEKVLLASAVFFSGCGDVILDLKFPQAFILGLLSFLTAHVLYIIIFAQTFRFNKSLAWLTFLGIIFPAGMYAFLFSHLGAMKIPVAVYVSVIGLMFVCSINRRSFNKLLIAGAATFLLSDSILATNKFYKPFPIAHLMVMFTYYLAQVLIVAGLLKERAR